MNDWNPLSRSTPYYGQEVDVWVVPTDNHSTPLKPYRVTDLTYTERGFCAGRNGPVQYDVTHWMETPIKPR